MERAIEKSACNVQPDQLDVLHLWRDALEGKNKEFAYDLMNQVMDGKITHEAALVLLRKIQDNIR